MSTVPNRTPYSQAPGRSDAGLGSALDLGQRATEIAYRLDVAGCRVLAEAAIPVLLGTNEPYIPASAEDAHIAAWLAASPLTLLVAEWAGYASCYRLTPLGQAVVRAFLTDYVLGRALAQNGAKRGA